jgi:hypothetical protein
MRGLFSYAISLFLVLSACVSDKVSEFSVIVPLDGCGGCVQKVLSYSEAKPKAFKQIVFTASSRKALNFLLKNIAFKSDLQIATDKELIFNKYPYNQGFPILIRLKDSSFFRIDASTDIQTLLNKN